MADLGSWTECSSKLNRTGEGTPGKLHAAYGRGGAMEVNAIGNSTETQLRRPFGQVGFRRRKSTGSSGALLQPRYVLIVGRGELVVDKAVRNQRRHGARVLPSADRRMTIGKCKAA